MNGHFSYCLLIPLVGFAVLGCYARTVKVNGSSGQYLEALKRITQGQLLGKQDQARQSRADGHLAAARQIEALPTAGVDREVVALGRGYAGFMRRAADVLGSAKGEDSPEARTLPDWLERLMEEEDRLRNKYGK